MCIRDRVIALQLVKDRRHLERHLVAGVHGRVDLGAEHVLLVIPWISLDPTAQGQGRSLGKVVPVQLGRQLLQIGHPGGSVGLKQRIAQLGSVCLLYTSRCV